MPTARYFRQQATRGTLPRLMGSAGCGKIGFEVFSGEPGQGLMETGSAFPTLLDEWQWRRDCLSRGVSSTTFFCAEQIRVLDFLIRRYRNSPEAQKPAPARLEAELCVDDRAIVVLNHLWKGKVGGVKTRQQAKDRISAILERMGCHASIPETGDAEITPGTPDADPAGARGIWSHLYDTFCVSDYDAEIRGALDRNPRLAGILYRRMMDSETDAKRAAELLVQATNPTALRYVIHGWRELARAGRKKRAWKVLDRFLVRPEPAAVVLDGIRESLCDSNAGIRAAAAKVLGCIGTLEDIGLLGDLLALPVAKDELPGDRAGLLHAMRKIAKARR
jgi:hypothetical protein